MEKIIYNINKIKNKQILIIMDWTVFYILLGFGIGNLIGFGLWLYKYVHEKHSVKWYKDGKFWLWFFYTLLFGITYAILRLILYIKELIIKKK